MVDDFISRVSILINASPQKVWTALTTPELIKKYLFGTEAISDWKEGSQIVYKGQWEGKSYEDKGTILKIIPEKLFQSTYWSSAYGLPDSPENYKNVTYELSEEDGRTKLTLTQDNNSSEAAKEHSESNWRMVLNGLKKVVEEESTS